MIHFQSKEREIRQSRDDKKCIYFCCWKFDFLLKETTR